jgi:hypothetical protein
LREVYSCPTTAVQQHLRREREGRLYPPARIQPCFWFTAGIFNHSLNRLRILFADHSLHRLDNEVLCGFSAKGKRRN